MLNSSKIPRSEPKIRVGIILPEDKQTKCRLEINAPIRIKCDNQYLKIETSELSFEIEQGNLVLHVAHSPVKCRNCTVIVPDPKQSIALFPVMAGRTFHWKKEIEVYLTHAIDIKVHDDYLVLINELPLEHYIACVATSEMSAECPESFLEAQTIVARSWMLANVEQKHVHLGFDVCNDDCCQRYQGSKNLTPYALNAAQNTRGQVLMFENNICDARYSKSCGGVTEKFEHLWEGEPLPYMVNQTDAFDLSLPDLTSEHDLINWLATIPKTFCSPHFVPKKELSRYLGKVDESGQYFRWEKKVTQEELLINFREKTGLPAKAIVDLVPLNRGGSGRILELRIDYLDQEENKKELIIHKDYQVRNFLHPEFLYSSACIIEKMEGPSTFPDFKYKGAGWGHGAGMCQIGALGMAFSGEDTRAILAHYYPGSTLQSIYL